MKATAPPDEAAIRRALQAGMQHHDAGRLAQAEAIYHEVLAAAPGRPEALALLGAIASAGARYDEAIDLLGRAIRANPAVPNFHHQLALALEARGRRDEALAAHRSAVQRGDRSAFRAAFARCLAGADRAPGDAGFRDLVARALSEAWARPADLARASIGLVRADPALEGPIATALRAWPARPSARELFGDSGLANLSRNRLLLALLENAQACDWGLERFLTLARHALVELALGDAPGAQDGIPFFCALARQCFLDDYVFAATGDEAEGARSLRERLSAAARAGADVPALWLAAVGSHVPLGSVPSVEALPERPWPASVRDLLVQQVVEPRAEREDRASIPQLTEVRDGVSRRVQRQYEQNPYPRWVRVPAAEPRSLEAHLRAAFPRAPAPPRGTGGAIDVLVAGCGTGQESAELAQAFPGCRVLAIDLSLASLAYARRKSREMGLANVDYAQADIMALEPAGRAFDVISSVGVLHHLRDPVAGWRRLLALLRPGGWMQVGLYSEAGRKDLAAARELIARRGYGPDPDGIRRCRQELLASAEFARLASLRDLYGMNECRDLLFHAEEHRFTLPQVKATIAALGLDLVGLVADAGVLRAYRERFGPDASEGDLDRWHAFEGDFPDTFAGMYLFWVRRRDGA